MALLPLKGITWCSPENLTDNSSEICWYTYNQNDTKLKNMYQKDILLSVRVSYICNCHVDTNYDIQLHNIWNLLNFKMKLNISWCENIRYNITIWEVQTTYCNEMWVMVRALLTWYRSLRAREKALLTDSLDTSQDLLTMTKGLWIIQNKERKIFLKGYKLILE